MPIDRKKNLAAEIRRVAEEQAFNVARHLSCAGENFSDPDYVRAAIADELEDAYKRIRNWE